MGHRATADRRRAGANAPSRLILSGGGLSMQPPPAGRSDRPQRMGTPTDPGCFACKFDSDDFLQDPRDALLDRFGSLCGDFLSEAPKFHILRGCDVEVLARLPC
jgi:hypothetical protein